MSEFEKGRADAVLASEEKQLQVMVELLRRQAKIDKEIHLAVSVDSAVMGLEREGAVLRDMRVEVGPEKTVGASPDTVRMTRAAGHTVRAAPAGSRGPVGGAGVGVPGPRSHGA